MSDPTGTASPTPGQTVRYLIRSCDRASLATLSASAGGEPYASLVLTACAQDATPLLFVSGLAEHTANMKADPRVSLLFDGTAGLDDPLTGARASLQGRVEPVVAARSHDMLKQRFLRRHPSAAVYAGFADFGLWRVVPDRAHLVAGFGRIHWVEAAALGFDIAGDRAASAALEAAEADIVAHMNEDHADALAGYATVLLGLPEGEWRMTGIDPEGVDLRSGGRVARLSFAAPVHDADSARMELIRLARRSRGGASTP